MSVSFSLTEAERALLGSIAVNAIAERLAGRKPEAPKLEDCPESVRRNLGCFVTLHEKGALRGCIGSIVGREPLARNVWRMAQAAAFEDPRFRPLAPSEWPAIDIEMTVLDQLTRCPDPKQIEIGRHGLVLVLGRRQGVFLPQVPVEQKWDLGQYLTHLCYKAELPDGSWKHPEAQLWWYEGLVFQVIK